MNGDGAGKGSCQSAGGGEMNTRHPISDYIQSDRYLITSHAKQRMIERGITSISLEQGVMNGDIIEEYLDDEPCPSVLVLAMINNNPIHIVIGLCTDHIRIITCYHPDEKE